MEKPALQKPPGFKDPTFPQPSKTRQIPPSSLKSPRRNPTVGSSRCCRILFSLILSILLLLAALSAFTYLYFHPRAPSFRAENINLQYFNVSSTFDGTYLDATLTVKIHAENRNSRLGLSCRGGEGEVAAADEDGDVALGEGRVARFGLGRGDLTVVRFGVGVKGVLVDDSVGVRLRRRFGRRELRFVVEVRMSVGFVVGGKLTPRVPIRVKCAGVGLKEVASVRPKCDVDIDYNGIL